jgi:hypothetical protein
MTIIKPWLVTLKINIEFQTKEKKWFKNIHLIRHHTARQFFLWMLFSQAKTIYYCYYYQPTFRWKWSFHTQEESKKCVLTIVKYDLLTIESNKIFMIDVNSYILNKFFNIIFKNLREWFGILILIIFNVFTGVTIWQELSKTNSP